MKKWDPRDRNSSTCLYMASGLDDLEMVRELLQHKEVEVNGKGSNGCTALILACVYDHLPIVSHATKEDI